MKHIDLFKKHEQFNNQHFGKLAKIYDYEKYFLFPIRQRAAAFLPIKPPARIIDVATGTGAQAYTLARCGFDVIGVDLSPLMLEQARKKLENRSLKLKFIQADATELPFKDNEFDGASISLGLHDMPHEIELATLLEVKRVVKKNGCILIVEHMEPSKHIVARLLSPFIRLFETPYYMPFIKSGLTSIVGEAGLSVKNESNWMGIIQIVLISNAKSMIQKMKS